MFSSCDKEEQIPSYIYIKEINLEVNSDQSQGSNAHDIVDAWVFVEGKMIGVFEMPATIPILAQGDQNVQIIAGIKKNGQSSDRIMYPFYSTYELDMELIPGHVDTLRPVVRYKDAVQFSWLEDFEDRSISLEKSGNLSTIDTLELISDAALVYGYNNPTSLYSVGGFLDTGFQYFEFSSTRRFDPPRGSHEVFLEFNFKTDLEMVSGFYPINSSIVQGVPVVNFYPTTQWKKAYVSLRQDISHLNHKNFDIRIFFAALKNNEDTTANVYLDNIKLVHF